VYVPIIVESICRSEHPEPAGASILSLSKDARGGSFDKLRMAPLACKG